MDFNVTTTLELFTTLTEHLNCFWCVWLLYHLWRFPQEILLCRHNVLCWGCYLFTNLINLRMKTTLKHSNNLLFHTQVVVISWVYGIQRTFDNLADMNIRFHKIVRAYWWTVWVVLTPVASVVSCFIKLYLHNNNDNSKFYIVDTSGLPSLLLCT